MIRKFIRGRVAAVIDAANLESALKSLGWHMDYRKLRSALSAGPPAELRYYCVRHGTENQDRFFAFLKHAGYRLFTLRLKRGGLFTPSGVEGLPRLKDGSTALTTGKGALSERSPEGGASRMGIPRWGAPFDFAQGQACLPDRQARRLAAACLTKPLKVIGDADMEKGKIRKANFDVEIALDVFRSLDMFDTLVLFSGDSDFDYLIRQLHQHGKHVVIISTRYHVSRELVRQCDKYIDLRKLRSLLERNGDGGQRKSPSFSTGS